MAYEDSKLSSPISIYDLQQCFEVVLKNGSTYKQSCDLGVLTGSTVGVTVSGWMVNSRNDINKWARYKPVCLPVPYPDDTPSDSTHWNETPLSGETWTFPDGLPWIYGCRQTPVYSVKTISDYTDIGSEGDVNPESMWVYNHPTLDNGYFFRLTDFVGYNHDAARPLTIGMTNKTAIAPSTIFTIAVTADANSSGKYNGEWAGGEILDMLNNSSLGVHLGVLTRYKRSGSTSWNEGCIVVKDPIPSEGTQESQVINIRIGTDIERPSLGLGVGDIVEFYAFLTSVDTSNLQVIPVDTSLCETTFGSLEKFSAYLDENCVVCRRYTVSNDESSGDITYVYIRFTHTVVAETSEFSAPVYINVDDSIYKCSRYIERLEGNVYFSGGSQAEQITQGFVYGSGTVVDENTAEPYSVDSAKRTSLGLSGFAPSTGCSLNGSYGSFVYYPTYEDAVNGTNGTTMNGIPLYSEVMYNNADADAVGEIINSTIRLSFTGSSSQAYTRVLITSDNNIINV